MTNQIIFNENQIREIKQAKSDLREKELSAFEQPLNDSKERIKKLEQNIESIDEQISAVSQKNDVDEIILAKENEIKVIQKAIEDTENLIRSNESEQIKKAQVIIKATEDGKAGPNTNRLFELWKIARQEDIQEYSKQINERRSNNEKKDASRISKLENEKRDFQNLLKQENESYKNLRNERA